MRKPEPPSAAPVTASLWVIALVALGLAGIAFTLELATSSPPNCPPLPARSAR